MEIAASTSVGFKPGAQLKQAVAKSRPRSPPDREEAGQRDLARHVAELALAGPQAVTAAAARVRSLRDPPAA